MERVKLYGVIINCGDGSATVEFFLNEEKADRVDNSQSEGWSEPSVFIIDTYTGSDTHSSAVYNEEHYEVEDVEELDDDYADEDLDDEFEDEVCGEDCPGCFWCQDVEDEYDRPNDK